jgi:hypothetical protein
MSAKIKLLAVLTMLGYSSIEFVEGQASLSEEDFGKLNDALEKGKTSETELTAHQKITTDALAKVAEMTNKISELEKKIVALENEDAGKGTKAFAEKDKTQTEEPYYSWDKMADDFLGK